MEFFVNRSHYSDAEGYLSATIAISNLASRRVGCIADDIVRSFSGGFEDGLSGHLLKCSLISDLNDLFQVFIRNSLIYTIISTTSTVICVNILHDNVKVNTQNSTPNTNMAAPSKWRAAFEGHFETLMRNI